MKHAILLAGLGLTAVAAGTAFAQSAPPPTTPAANIHRTAPRLPDTRAEVEANVRTRFASLDRNHDGYLTPEELRWGPPRQDQSAGDRRKARRDHLFAMMDKDGNGTISKAEFENFHPDRAHAGGFGPGSSRQQIMVLRRDGMFVPPHHMYNWRIMAAGMMFRRADADHDGRVSLAEAEKASLARFDRVDTNHDGVLSEAERQAAATRMAARFDRFRRFERYERFRHRDFAPPPPTVVPSPSPNS